MNYLLPDGKPPLVKRRHGDGMGRVIATKPTPDGFREVILRTRIARAILRATFMREWK